jgi:hypothetical protein
MDTGKYFDRGGENDEDALDEVENEEEEEAFDLSYEDILSKDDLEAEDLAAEEVFDTQHTDGHTYNVWHARQQGLTYTPPTDPPVMPDDDEPEGVAVTTGFAQNMEDSDPDVEDLPPHVDNNDLEIQEDVYQALRYNSETTHLTDLQVEVNNGVVTIRGTVLDEDDIALVYDIVNELEGVVDVEIELDTEL